jgi:hypothetical protein
MGFEGLKDKPAFPELIERFTNYPESEKCNQ